MSNLGAGIVAYCAQRAIRIQHLEKGATRFVGPGVDLLVADARRVTLQDLEPYDPRKGRALDNI